MKQKPDIERLAVGVRGGDRALLARAITLVESCAPEHQIAARQLMESVLPHTGGSIRIGLTGVPGAGKSTLIEALGLHLCGLNQKVAVLAVDPTSSLHGGSILGDKTRMEGLCHEANAFIRPSPSGNSLGGVAARTRESLLLCEAAGYDVTIIETVGIGQSESEVRTMTDCFLLVQIPGAGDSLQGIKKGVIELADAIVVNKADGPERVRAQQVQADFLRLLRFLQPFTPGWEPQALMCSALQGDGVAEIWELICRFISQTRKSGIFERRRCEQNVDWLHALMQQTVMQRFKAHNAARIEALELAVANGAMPVASALGELMEGS
jgi:LAO/AO transport system kinase